MGEFVIKLLFNVANFVKVILWSIVAYFWCDINPYQRYDWLDGLWHGLNAPSNLVLSIFSDATIKSANGTLGYNLSWWALATPLLCIFSCSALVIIFVIISGLWGLVFDKDKKE